MVLLYAEPIKPWSYFTLKKTNYSIETTNYLLYGNPFILLPNEAPAEQEILFWKERVTIFCTSSSISEMKCHFCFIFLLSRIHCQDSGEIKLERSMSFLLNGTTEDSF